MNNTEILDLSRQNSPDNIRRLAAQKQIYFDGKSLFLWQLGLTGPVTILLSLTKVILSTVWKVDISWLSATVGLFLTIFELAIIQGIIGSRRTDAAKIQEAFDTSVYEMPWNEFLVGKRPEIETINRYSRKFERRDRDGAKMRKLTHWYPIEADGMPLFKGILVCQKANVHYDFSLRESFRRVIFIVAGVTFLLLFAFTLVEDFSIRSILSQLVVPFLPMLTLSLKLNNEHSKSIKNLTELKQLLNRQVAEADADNSLSIEILRRLQDRIYLSRKDSSLIPDQFYDRLRNRLESEMHDNAATIT